MSFTLTLSRAFALDLVEDVAVGLRDRLCFVGAGDLLAEHVDRGQLARSVQRLHDTHAVLERGACDVPRGEALHHRPRNGGQQSDHCLVEQRHGRRDCRPTATSLAHEALACGADERHRLGEEQAHGVAKRDRLLVDAARGLHLRECRGRQLDGRVQRQRGELLALRLLHAFRLLLGELPQAPHQVLGIAAEGKSESAAAFHALNASCARASHGAFVLPLDLGRKLLDGGQRLLERSRERRAGLLAERALEPA